MRNRVSKRCFILYQISKSHFFARIVWIECAYDFVVP
jgi:hypothetical protein